VLKWSFSNAGVAEQENENCQERRMRSLDHVTSDELGHPCGVDSCIQCRACLTLRGTIDQLHSTLAEHSEVDRRVRELEGEDTASSPEDLEVVDFEAEYRELESLVRELKKVLVVDRSTEGCPLIGKRTEIETESENESMTPSLSTGVQWNFYDDDDEDDDETVSMVTSPDSEIDSPALAALNGRNHSLEISEQYLRQQVSFGFGFSLLCLNRCRSDFGDGEGWGGRGMDTEGDRGEEVTGPPVCQNMDTPMAHGGVWRLRAVHLYCSACSA